MADTRLSACIDIQQFGGGITDLLGRLALGLLPLLGAQLVQRRQLVTGPGIARDQVQAVHRHVELCAIGVFEREELGFLPPGVDGLQPQIAADAVGVVHHRRAFTQLREVAHGQLVVIGGARLAAALTYHFAVELGLGDDHQPLVAVAVIAGQGIFCLRAGHPGTMCQATDGQADGGWAVHEVLEACEVIQAAQPEAAQQRGELLLYDFAAALGLGDEQHTLGMFAVQALLEEAGQGLGRVGAARIDGQARQRLMAEFDGVGIGLTYQLDTLVLLDQAQQLIDRHEGAVRWQQRACRVDAQIGVAGGDGVPVALGCLAHAGQHGDAQLVAHMIKERRGLVEEQRQVLLEPRRGNALDGVVVENALARVDIEQRLEALAEAGDGATRQRVFMCGQNLDRLDLVATALGVRVEGTQGVDLVIEQVDAQRLLAAHGEQVDQCAAQGVFARLVDRLHRAVTGSRQA